MQNGFSMIKGLSNLEMYRPFSLVTGPSMSPTIQNDYTREELILIDLCDEQIDYKYKKFERFDTLKELETRLRSYTKEAGFGLIIMQLKEKDKQNFRIAKCSKGVSKKQMQE